VLEQVDGYLHATATSALFGFVDDLELYADPSVVCCRRARFRGWGIPIWA
jgi:uncharacterized protein (DUF1499 family)